VGVGAADLDYELLTPVQAGVDGHETIDIQRAASRVCVVRLDLRDGFGADPAFTGPVGEAGEAPCGDASREQYQATNSRMA
jgi:hypothetical protein